MHRFRAAIILALVVGFTACGEEGGEPSPRHGGDGGQGGQGGQGGGDGEGGSTGGAGGDVGSGGTGGSGAAPGTGGSGAAPGTGGDGGDGGSGGSPPLPDVRVLTPRLASIVDPLAAEEVRARLGMTQGSNLARSVERFFEVFPDDFDFLFFFAAAPGSPAVGVHLPVNRPAIPGTGIDFAYKDRTYPSEKLRSVIALRLGSNGPTLHEVAHHWAAYLSSELGFSWGHWEYAGVHGQLGGFDPETLFCETPAGSRPPCDAGEDGLTSFIVKRFGLVANGGDSVPYAPLELYLMGLLPPEEVPPIPILEDVVEDKPGPDSTRRILARSLRTVTIEDIIAHHGHRPLAPEADRRFRGAFVLVTEEEPTESQVQDADGWASMFGCHDPDRWVLCFEDATDGLATMDIGLP